MMPSENMDAMLAKPDQRDNRSELELILSAIQRLKSIG